jgi:hypothetical protein
MPEPRYAATTLVIAQTVKNSLGTVDYRYINSLSVRNHEVVNLEVNLQNGEYIVMSMLSGRLMA